MQSTIQNWCSTGAEYIHLPFFHIFIHKVQLVIQLGTCLSVKIDREGGRSVSKNGAFFKKYCAAMDGCFFFVFVFFCLQRCYQIFLFGSIFAHNPVSEKLLLYGTYLFSQLCCGDKLN